ncbi:MAG: Arylsulfatase, partial [Verrucomicrobiota bacterium]
MFLVALLLTALAPLSAAELSKPNIIFVLYDDLGYGEPPSYNPKSALRTPNLDKLAT